MTFKGPGDRTIELDTYAGALTNITTLVRSIEGVEEQEATMEDATSVADTRPTRRPNGFIETKDISLELSQDTGGTYDPRTQLVANLGGANLLTLKVTYSTGKYWQTECLIASAKMNTPAKGETTCSVTLSPTGAPTTA